MLFRSQSRNSDPLAELARIVGKDDPFKAMFADSKQGQVPPPLVPASPRRIEPTLDDLLKDLPAKRTLGAGPVAQPLPVVAGVGATVAQAAVPAASPPLSSLDEFDALLRQEMRGTLAPVAQSQPLPASAAQGPAADMPRDLDAFSERLRADEAVPPLEPATDYPEPPAGPIDDLRSLEPAQPRRGLVIAGVLLGVAALGIGGIVGLRSLSGPMVGNGEPPVIRAEAGPAKVAPQNPGGVEIPNQNKQIYERSPDPRAADTRVVNREEQPVDVQSIARAAPRVVLPGPGTALPAVPASPQPATGSPVTPAPVSAAPVIAAPSPRAVDPVAIPNPATAAVEPSSTTAVNGALGEPRRVRTVAVRPDGTIANGAPAAPTATASTGTPAAGQTANGQTATGQTAAPPAVPRPAQAVTPAPRPPAPVPRPPERTQTAALPAATDPAVPAVRQEARPETRADGGNGSGFMVQLGAPGSESEARATFSSLQRRFSGQLGDDTPVIRRAELGNGRTVYRLRVGPFSRDDATEKCQALQNAGGQCFIARN